MLALLRSSSLISSLAKEVRIWQASLRLPTAYCRLLTFFVVLLTAHGLLPVARAQSPDPVDVVKIETDLVNLNVSVFDHKSNKPKVLDQRDFAIFDEGTPQEISFFAAADT